MDNKALKNKVIITAAVTGAWPKKENNPNVPMTPQEIADDVYACWKAGRLFIRICEYGPSRPLIRTWGKPQFWQLFSTRRPDW